MIYNETIDTAHEACKIIKTPIGNIFILANDKGLKLIKFIDDGNSYKYFNSFKIYNTIAGDICLRTEKELIKYFKKQLINFTIPLVLDGTDFEIKVWKELCRIPYGKTISYKQIAHNINRPKAFRAVGNANSKNKIPIIVPCHRVVASDGSLGGYSLGLRLKRFLLNLEIDITS